MGAGIAPHAAPLFAGSSQIRAPRHFLPHGCHTAIGLIRKAGPWAPMTAEAGSLFSAARQIIISPG